MAVQESHLQVRKSLSRISLGKLEDAKGYFTISSRRGSGPVLVDVGIRCTALSWMLLLLFLDLNSARDAHDINKIQDYRSHLSLCVTDRGHLTHQQCDLSSSTVSSVMLSCLQDPVTNTMAKWVSGYLMLTFLLLGFST